MTEARTIAQIEEEIAQTQEALQNVRGTETEVYARIVGYYRSVRNWNKGKRDEYDIRKQFIWDSDESNLKNSEVVVEAEEKTPVNEVTNTPECSAEEVYYEYFSRRTCPNCQPVKKRLETLEVTGIHIDVDTPEGLESASKMGVLSAPTVIVFDKSGTELGRAHNVSELNSLLTVKCECVA